MLVDPKGARGDCGALSPFLCGYSVVLDARMGDNGLVFGGLERTMDIQDCIHHRTKPAQKSQLRPRNYPILQMWHFFHAA